MLDMYVTGVLLCLYCCTIPVITGFNSSDSGARHVKNLNFRGIVNGKLVLGLNENAIDGSSEECNHSNHCGDGFWKTFGIVAVVLVAAIFFLLVGLYFLRKRKRENKWYWTRRNEALAEAAGAEGNRAGNLELAQPQVVVNIVHVVPKDAGVPAVHMQPEIPFGPDNNEPAYETVPSPSAPSVHAVGPSISYYPMPDEPPPAYDFTGRSIAMGTDGDSPPMSRKEVDALH